MPGESEPEDYDYIGQQLIDVINAIERDQDELSDNSSDDDEERDEIYKQQQFLKTFLIGIPFQRLLTAHDCLSTSRISFPEDDLKSGFDIMTDVMKVLDQTQAEDAELYDILSDYHVKALIESYEAISYSDYAPPPENISLAGMVEVSVDQGSKPRSRSSRHSREDRVDYTPPQRPPLVELPATVLQEAEPPRPQRVHKKPSSHGEEDSRRPPAPLAHHQPEIEPTRQHRVAASPPPSYQRSQSLDSDAALSIEDDDHRGRSNSRGPDVFIGGGMLGDDSSFSPSLPSVAHQSSQLQTPQGRQIKVVSMKKSQGQPLGFTVVRSESVFDERGVTEVVVERVIAGSVAEKGGMCPGDIVQFVDTYPIGSVDDVKQFIRQAKDKITVKVLPMGRQHTVDSEKIYMRTFFKYDPKTDSLLPKGSQALSFEARDVVEVVNKDDTTWWQARHLDSPDYVGLIPSQTLEERRQAFTNPPPGTPAQKKSAEKISACNPILRKLSGKKSNKNKFIFSAVNSPELMDRGDMKIYDEVMPYPAGPLPCVLIVGAPGVGRRSVKEALCQLNPRKYVPPKSESGPTLQLLPDIREGQFVEWNQSSDDGSITGVRFSALDDVIRARRTVVLDCLPMTIRLLNSAEYRPFVVFLKAPSLDDLIAMQQEGMTAGVRRSVKSKAELGEVIDKSKHLEDLYSSLADLVVINSDIKQSAKEVHNFIQTAERETRWIPAGWQTDRDIKDIESTPINTNRLSAIFATPIPKLRHVSKTPSITSQDAPMPKSALRKPGEQRHRSSQDRGVTPTSMLSDETAVASKYSQPPSRVEGDSDQHLSTISGGSVTDEGSLVDRNQGAPMRKWSNQGSIASSQQPIRQQEQKRHPEPLNVKFSASVPQQNRPDPARQPLQSQPSRPPPIAPKPTNRPQQPPVQASAQRPPNNRPLPQVAQPQQPNNRAPPQVPQPKRVQMPIQQQPPQQHRAAFVKGSSKKVPSDDETTSEEEDDVEV